MKPIYKIISILILALIAVSTASASTDKVLPSEKDVRTYIENGNSSDNYVTSLFENSQTENPTWPCDLWKTMSGNNVVSFYFSDDSAKGYGSLYVSGKGEITAHGDSGLTLEKSYTGVEDAATDNSSTDNVSSCPNCQTNETEAPTENISVSDSSLTEEQQKQLEEFMSYFDGKESVTVDGIKEQAIECFFQGGQ